MLIFITNTLIGFAIDHFLFSHSSAYQLSECLLSKAVSFVIAAVLCVLAICSGLSTRLLESLDKLHISLHNKLESYIGAGTEWQESESCYTFCSSVFYPRSLSEDAPDLQAREPLIAAGNP